MADNFNGFIGLDDDVDGFIKNINEINWFSNCGNDYIEKLEYGYILAENIETARKNLIRSNNYSGIITVENLFQEANHRLYSYLKNNEKINLSVENLKLNSWVNLRGKITAKIGENENIFNNINEKYYKKFNVKRTAYTFLWHLSTLMIMEIYSEKIFPEIPVFFKKIIKIYIDGHIITGWKGKFPSQYLFIDKPIDNKKGTLIIW
ncbi:MAG: hypothetical protein LBH21_00450 [Gracilibacteraceae bacterium]|jgi:hypothetical protein|nr:hypothetical protein [Gracilibacteraceae bacterium]